MDSATAQLLIYRKRAELECLMRSRSKAGQQKAEDDRERDESLWSPNDSN